MSFLTKHTLPSIPQNRKQYVPLNNVRSFSAGYHYVIAIQGDGTLVGWGDNTYGQCPPDMSGPEFADIKQVACGRFCTLALKTDGTIVGWGDNINSLIGSDIPVYGLDYYYRAVVFSRVHTSTHYAIAQNAGGLATFWGTSSAGNAYDYRIYLEASNVFNTIEIKAGLETPHFLRADGTQVCGTKNYYNANVVNVDTSIYPPTSSAEISPGIQHTYSNTMLAPFYLSTYRFGIDIEHSCYSYGTIDQYRKLHVTNSLGATADPYDFGILATVYPIIKTAMGPWNFNAKLALRCDGKVFDPFKAYGTYSNIIDVGQGYTNVFLQQSNGQLISIKGVSTTVDRTLVPPYTGDLVIPFSNNIYNNPKQLAAGIHFSCSLQTNGQVRVWGDDSYTQTSLISPNATGLRKISCGAHHVVGIRADSSVIGWGSNVSGETNIPVGLSALEIAAGDEYTLAINHTGAVVGWGNSGNGRLNIPSTITGNNAAKSISTRYQHALALGTIATTTPGPSALLYGTVIAWGNNTSEQCNVPVELSTYSTANVKQVAAGNFHSMALKADGTVRVWGDNSHGQCNIPEDLYVGGFYPVIEIAAGNFHCMALRADGSVRVWGWGSLSQVPDLALGKVIHIAAGAYHCLALLNNGTIVTWGDDSQKQITNNPFPSS